MSPMATQYAPDAVRLPDNWGVVVLATAAVVPPCKKMQFPDASGLPIPSPMVMVAGGPADVMVTLTDPGVVTVKLWTFVALCCTVPVNVSVVTAADGDVMLDVLFDPPHAATAETTTAR